MDLILHVSVSVIIMVYTFMAFLNMNNRPNLSYKISLLVTIFLGTFKECYDLWSYGLFSFSDLLFDFVGMGIGTIICIKISHKNKGWHL